MVMLSKKAVRKYTKQGYDLDFLQKVQPKGNINFKPDLFYYGGDGYYTVKEASVGYFDKEPAYMTDYEATLLAGIPNAPSIYSPTKNLDLTIARQWQVINQMVKYEFLTKEKAEKILNESD